MAQNTALRPGEHTMEERPGHEPVEGLCTSCVRLESCTLRAEGRIIQFCEEFAVEAGPLQRAFPRGVREVEPVDAA